MSDNAEYTIVEGEAFYRFVARSKLLRQMQKPI